MIKRKEKKNLWIFIGIIIVVFASFIFLLFSVVQVTYSTTVDTSKYTKTYEETVGMYMNGQATLSPNVGEKIYFELRLVSPDVDSGQSRPLGMLEYGVVDYGNPYSVGCWWGNEDDYQTDCSIYYARYHVNTISNSGGSCDEVYESCASGLICDGTVCVSDDECSIDSDCPDGGYDGDAYCYNGDVYKNYNDGICFASGDCGFDTIRKLMQECSGECSNGACVSSTTPISDETCTDGEERTTDTTIYVCDEPVNLKQICVGGVWQDVTYSSTICDTNTNISSVYGDSSTTGSNSSGSADIDWTRIVITILVSALIIGLILVIDNYKRNKSPKKTGRKIMTKKSSKKNSKKKKIIFISVAIISLIAIIYFSFIQAYYTGTPSTSTYTRDPSSDWQVTWSGQYIYYVGTANGEVLEFEFCSDGNCISGWIPEDSYHTFGGENSNWDDTENVFTGHWWTATEYNSEGGSCAEYWEFCDDDWLDCISGTCVDNSECHSDIYCSDTGWIGIASCDGDDIVQDYAEGYCDNSWECSTRTVEKVKQTCDYGCSGGNCITAECTQASDCPASTLAPSTYCLSGQLFTETQVATCESNSCGLDWDTTLTKTCSDDCAVDDGEGVCVEDFINDACSNGDIILTEHENDYCGYVSGSSPSSYTTDIYHCVSNSWEIAEISFQCDLTNTGKINDCGDLTVSQIQFPVFYNDDEKLLTVECDSELGFLFSELEIDTTSSTGGTSSGDTSTGDSDTSTQDTSSGDIVAGTTSFIEDALDFYEENKISAIIVGGILLVSIAGIIIYLKLFSQKKVGKKR